MKKSICIILLFIITSCYNKIPSVSPAGKIPNKYEVTNIRKYGDVCKYTLKYPTAFWTDYKQTIFIIDSIGKFKIGDKVVIKMIKEE